MPYKKLNMRPLIHRMYPSHVVHFHEAAVTAAATTTVYRLAPVMWKAPAGWSREPVFEFESPTYRFDRLSPTRPSETHR